MFVKCKIQGCGFNSENNFCLNRLVVINEQGICNYLTKPGWDQQVEDRFKNNYQSPRAPVEEDLTDPEEEYIVEIGEIWGQE